VSDQILQSRDAFDVAASIPYQSRHGVIIQRRDVMGWLDGSIPNEVLFEEPPRHSFFVEPLRAQTEFAL